MKGLLFAILLISSAFVQAQTKVGFTNVELIMTYMPDVDVANKSLDEYARRKSDGITRKKLQLAGLIQQYEEKSKLASFSGSKEETDLVTEITVQEKLIKAKEENFPLDVQDKKSQLLSPILNKIQAAIDAVAEENGYTYILNQTSGSNILYGVKQYDVTDKIAAKLGIEISE